MDFLPRTKKEVTKHIPVKKQEIRIDFDEDQVKEALLAKFGNMKIGPEGYQIPQDCQVEIITGVELYFYVDE